MFYEKMKSVADRLITKFGQPVTIQSGSTSAKTYGVFTNNTKRPFGESATTEDEKELVIRAVKIKVASGDTVFYKGGTYRVITAEEVNPGGTQLTQKITVQ
jgi:hypothetical protein